MTERLGGWSVLILVLATLFGAMSIGALPVGAAAPGPVTVGVSYHVFGGGSGYGAPTFSYAKSGVVQNVQLSRNVTFVTIDSRSFWSVSSQLPGSNLTIRWATRVASGTASAGMLTNFTYYLQANVQLGYSVVGGGKASVQVNCTLFGIPNPTKPAGGSSWLDVGSSFSYLPIALSAITGERWATLNATSGTISGPASFSTAYFHQYLAMADYSSSEGNVPGTPSLNGTSFGSSVSAVLTSSYSLLWLDAQSQYQVTPAFYSSPNERWAVGSASGLVAAPLVLSPTYYHQYSLLANYNLVGGSSPGQPLMQYTSEGSVVAQPLSQSPVQFWVDAGTAYGVPAYLPGSSSTERWILIGPQWSNLIGSPTKASPTYDHQYALQISFTSVGNSSFYTPSMKYISMGVSQNTTLGQQTAWADSGTAVAVTRFEAGPTAGTMWKLGTRIPTTALSPLTVNAVYYLQVEVQVSYQILGGGSPPGPGFSYVYLGSANNTILLPASSYWVDSGSAWSVQSIIQGTTGERWALQGGASIGSVKGPFTLGLSYQHQYLVLVSTDRFGGGEVANSTGWYSPGQLVKLSAIASNGWKFGQWTGTPSLTANPVSLIVNGSMSETAGFYPGIAVNAGSGGMVTVVAEPNSGKATPSTPFLTYVYPGMEVTVYATSNRFYQFVVWSGSETGNQNPLTFIVTAPMQINAEFNVPVTSYVLLVAGVSMVVVGGYFALRLLTRRRKGLAGDKLWRLKFGRR